MNLFHTFPSYFSKIHHVIFCLWVLQVLSYLQFFDKNFVRIFHHSLACHVPCQFNPPGLIALRTCGEEYEL